MSGLGIQSTSPRSVSLQLKIIYFFLLWSLVVEWFASGLFAAGPGKWPVKTLEIVFMALAFAEVVIVWYFRFVRVESLSEQANIDLSGPVLVKLRAYYIICFVCAYAVSVYGMVARMTGSSTGRAAAFFVAAVVLFVLCFPRIPVDSTVPPSTPPSAN